MCIYVCEERDVKGSLGREREGEEEDRYVIVVSLELREERRV